MIYSTKARDLILFLLNVFARQLADRVILQDFLWMLHFMKEDSLKKFRFKGWLQ